jgi:peptidoglycan/LPS O-acetylase OafA/YrhL
MYQARNYLFYVALGAAVGPWLVRLMVDAPAWALAACSAVGFGVLTALSWKGWGNVQFTNPAGALAGTFAVIALTGVMERCGRAFAWVEYLGRVSLPIYVAHVLALSAARAGLVKGLHVSSTPVHVVVGTVVGVAIPVALAWGAERFRMGWLFTLPKLGRRGA